MDEKDQGDEFRVQELFDGSMQVEHKLADGSTQFSNFTKDKLVIENDKGVSSVDLEQNIFNLAALKNLEILDAVSSEQRKEGEMDIQRYIFSEFSWVDVKYLKGVIQGLDANNVDMNLTEKGTRLKISGIKENP